ncbi:MAG: hypothetical protein PHS33_09375 [Candidatus Omnitrophica bacterium]|nr:hypothetical protein [Candidatus Omnitrophota bacterium]
MSENNSGRVKPSKITDELSKAIGDLPVTLDKQLEKPVANPAPVEVLKPSTTLPAIPTKMRIRVQVGTEKVIEGNKIVYYRNGKRVGGRPRLTQEEKLIRADGILTALKALDSASKIKWSKTLGIPVKALSKVLDSDDVWNKHVEKVRRGLALLSFDVLETLLKNIKSKAGQLPPHTAGILYGILHDKAMPSLNQAEAVANINIGDNRQIKVYYPNFGKSQGEVK